MNATIGRIFGTALRVLAVFALYALLWLVTTSVGMPREALSQLTDEHSRGALEALPLVALPSSGVLSYLILRARWSGPKLVWGIGLSFYAVHTFLQQIETLAFPAVARRMPAGMITWLFLTGAAFSILLAPAAVLVLGRWRGSSEAVEDPRRGPLASKKEWAWKLLVSALLYEVLYFTFGYFIAWRTPGLPEFYGGRDPGSFFRQLGSVLSDTPWLLVLQLVRGALFSGVALLIVRMQRGGVVETSLCLGAFFSLTVAAQLFFPNPYLPEHVLAAHRLELALSNFLYGALLAPLWMWRGKPVASEPFVVARA